MFNQFVFGYRGGIAGGVIAGRAADDYRPHFLAPFQISDADDRRLVHAGMLNQRLLHFLRRNHFAAPLDKVPRPPGQIDIPVGVLPRQIPGIKPAVADSIAAAAADVAAAAGIGIGVGIAAGCARLPVSRHNAGAARYNFSGFAYRNGVAVLAYNHHLYIVQWLADGSQTPQLALNFVRFALQDMVVRRQHRDGGRRFGLPESVDEPGAGKGGDGVPDDRQGHRRRPVSDDIQGGKVVLGETGMLHYPFEHRRHQHRPVDAMLGGQRQPALRVKLGHYYQRAPAEHRRQRRLHPGHMIHWHREQVGFGNIRVGGRHIRQQKCRKTVVRQPRALGDAGSAGGEHYHRSGIRIVLREMLLLRVRIGQQGVIADTAAGRRRIQHYDAVAGDRTVGRRQATIAFPQKQQLRLYDGQHRCQFVRFGAEVDRHIDGVPLGGGEVNFQQLVAVGLHRRHPVAAPDAQSRHPVGQAVDPLLQPLKADAPPVIDHRRAVRDDGGGQRQNFGSVHPLITRPCRD